MMILASAVLAGSLLATGAQARGGGGGGGGHGGGGFGGGHMGGFGGAHIGGFGGGRIGGFGGGHVGGFGAGRIAHVGHEHFGRRRFGGGYYGYGLGCSYDPYYTSNIRTAASTERQVDPEAANARLSTPLTGSPGRAGEKQNASSTG